MPTPAYDAFLSYNRAESIAVEHIALYLTDEAKIACWFDKWVLLPGRPWQEEMEIGLASAKVAVVLVGKNGISPWHNEEMRVALDMRTRDTDGRAVIPVLLPGAQVSDIPHFLRRLTWVDLRDGISDAGLALLAKGILGLQPGRITSGGSAGDRMAPPVDPALLANVESTIHAVQRWARHVQNEDGGLPTDGEGSPSCTWGTAGLLWTLWVSGANFQTTWMRRALTWVLDNTNEDGGIPVVIRGDPSITDATAQTVLACCANYLDTSHPRVHRAIHSLTDWLLVRQGKTGGFAWRPGKEPCLTTSTAFALVALDRANAILHSEDLSEAIARCHEWLLTTRNSDCGWGSRAGETSRPAVAGIVTYALATTNQHDEACESLQYIKTTQSADGHWPVVVDRPFGGHSITRFADAYCVLALAATAPTAKDPSMTSGLDALMRSYRHPHFQYLETTMHTWPTRDSLLALAAVARRLGSTKIRDEGGLR